MVAEIVRRLNRPQEVSDRSRFLGAYLEEWIRPPLEGLRDGDLTPAQFLYLCARALQVGYDHLRNGDVKKRTSLILEGIAIRKEHHDSIYGDFK